MGVYFTNFVEDTTVYTYDYVECKTTVYRV